MRSAWKTSSRFVVGPLLTLLVLVLAWQFLGSFFPRQELAIRQAFSEQVRTWFPEQAREAAGRFGLRLHASAGASRGDVVLVHGLDDPGKVWMNMRPALRLAGYRVWEFDYPNDQPIARSAGLLHAELVRLAGRGVAAVDMVAHSMGGLVARDVLSRPAWRCSPGHCAAGPMPRVRQLIMIGTPNQGSQFARVRGLAEVREQLSRALRGEAGWLDWVFDGAGEAGFDLLPDSAFLTALNARPSPADTRMTVIAGVIAQDEINGLLAVLDPSPGAGDRTADTGYRDWRGALEDHLGDGLVTVHSARIPGVPLVQVSGNHLSIVRNVSAASERVPPAVPLVLGMLAVGADAGSSRPADL